MVCSGAAQAPALNFASCSSLKNEIDLQIGKCCHAGSSNWLPWLPEVGESVGADIGAGAG